MLLPSVPPLSVSPLPQDKAQLLALARQPHCLSAGSSCLDGQVQPDPQVDRAAKPDPWGTHLMAMLPHLPRRAIPQRDCRPLPVGGRGYQDDRGLTCGQVHLHAPPHTPHPPALPSPTLSPPCSPEVSGIPAEAKRNVPQQWYTVFKPMRRDQRGDFPAWPRAGCVSLEPATPSLGPSPPLRPRADLPDSTIQLRSLSTPIHACAVPFLRDASPPLPLGALWEAVLAAAGGAGLHGRGGELREAGSGAPRKSPQISELTRSPPSAVGWVFFL